MLLRPFSLLLMLSVLLLPLVAVADEWDMVLEGTMGWRAPAASPDGTVSWRVFFYKNGLPAPNDLPAAVELLDSIIPYFCNCMVTSDPPIPNSFETTATTEEDEWGFPGVAKFYSRAGGCVAPEYFGVPIVGVKIRLVGIQYWDHLLFFRSTDPVDEAGLLYGQDGPGGTSWDPNGVCVAGLSDATYITGPIQTFTYDWCVDRTSDGSVSLNDASLFTPAIKAGAACNRTILRH